MLAPMSSPPRIKSLRMQNYRGMRDCTIEFADGPVTVIAGENGVGKTAVLDCLAKLIALCLHDDEADGFSADDVSRGYDSLSCVASLQLPSKGESELPARRAVLSATFP